MINNTCQRTPPVYVLFFHEQSVSTTLKNCTFFKTSKLTLFRRSGSGNIILSNCYSDVTSTVPTGTFIAISSTPTITFPPGGCRWAPKEERHSHGAVSVLFRTILALSFLIEAIS
jgi:hypothetical protein